MKNRNDIIRLVTVVLISLSILCCNDRKKAIDYDAQVLQAVYHFFENDTLASYYVERFPVGGDKDWKGYLEREMKSFGIKKLALSAMLFSLPQHCAGCHNYYNLLVLSDNQGWFLLMPLMDDDFYDLIEKKEGVP